jgi:AraC-like DNA-binding protein
MENADKAQSDISLQVDSLAAEILDTIHTCSRIAGMSVCFHDYTNELIAMIGRNCLSHDNPFCSAVKKKHKKTCMRGDMDLVYEQFDKASKPFLKICHAGVCEAVVPVHRNGMRVAAIFIGPFAWKENEPLPENAVVQSTLKKRLKEYKRLRAKLPVIDQDSIENIAGLARMLAYHIGLCLTQVSNDLSVRGSYKKRISTIMRSRLNHELTLGQLAEELYLSPSRTSQLVRKHFGMTFPELLNTCRVEFAMHYLVDTSLNLATIINCTGFKDKSYFHRIFKRHTGMTPREYRLRATAGELSKSV